MKVMSEMLDCLGIPINEGIEKVSQKDTFLPKNLIMLDLEMSGVIPERDDILQIAMIKLELQSADPRDYGYLEVGRPLEIFIHSDKQPSNDFHEKYLKDIFAKANESKVTPEEAKKLIHEWLGDLKGVVTPCGDAVHCDMGFLYAKGCIDRGDIGDAGPIPGTFHYEIFDLNSLKLVARQLNGEKEKLKLEDGIHNALVDCRNQTTELNWMLKVLINER